MKFKLDENFGTRTQELFLSKSHDLGTVCGQGLGGASDSALYRICCEEGRCLVTLDRDFADVTRFPPKRASGIAVIRLPKNATLTLLERLVGQFLAMLSRMSVERQLWIVEPGRIRVHQSPEE